MKTAFLLFFALLSIQISLAEVPEDVAEEQEIEQKVTEVSSLKPKSLEERKKKESILDSIRQARRGFKEWKLRNPNHKEIRKEFKSVLTKIKKDGTPENQALKKATEKCKENQSDCMATLKSNIESIYTNSEIPVMAKKQGFSFLSHAYASSALSTITCSTGSSASQGTYYLGLYGQDQDCNLTFIGPGLGLIGLSHHVLVCVGDGSDKTVGLYASATAVIAGLGVGLTVGSAGFCQLLSLNTVGVGAFAGLVITEAGTFE